MRSREIAQGMLHEPYSRFLGLRESSSDTGEVSFEIPFRDELSNPGRQVHGGVLASALGIAARMAALAEAEPGAGGPLSATTAELNVAYLSSAVGEAMIARAETIRRGRELVHVRAEVSSTEGKRFASAIAIIRIAPEKPHPLAPIEPQMSWQGDEEIASIARALTSANYIRAVGMKVRAMRGGRAALELPYREDLSDAHGRHHEGVLAALVDTAGALAAWSLVKPAPGMRVSTVSIDVNFCPVPPGSTVYATALTRARQKELFFNRVEALTEDHRPVALGSVIYRIVLPE